MLRILIVDDGAEKTRQIARVVAAIPEIQQERVDTVSTLRGARVALLGTAYDLLILDLLIPEQADQDPDPNGGIRLLEELRSRPGRYRMPSYVVGVTEHTHLREQAADVFAQSTLAVLLYDRATDAWQRTLTAALEHIIAAKAGRAASAEGFRSALAIVCALPLELDAVRRLPWNWDEQVYTTRGDPTAYYHGWFEVRGERREVYAASAPRMGMPAAAVLATKMINAFAPRLVAMPGIAAGVRGAVEIGDVIVADPAWDYGSGKWVEHDGGSHLQIAPHQIGLAPPLRTALSLLAEDEVTLAKIEREWPAEPCTTRLRVHLGPVASGSAVLADRRHVEQIISQNRKALGVDMEAYGVYVAAQETVDPAPAVVVLKGVVDFADPNKGDSFQRYGAYVSAAALRHLAERVD